MRYLMPAILSGCSAGSGVFVGPVDDSDAVVGLALGSDGGLLYVCGGAASMATLDHWVPVRAEGDRLSGAADGVEVEADRDGDGWSGEILTTPSEGESSDAAGVRTFALAQGAGPDGPYEPDGLVGECPAGAVVLDGGERLQGIACAQPAAPAQVVPVGVIPTRSESFEVRADSDPPLEFVVVPVRP